jgi:hypothetical protein
MLETSVMVAARASVVVAPKRDEIAFAPTLAAIGNRTAS